MEHHRSTEGIEPAFPGQWDQYNFSPASRTQYPIRIHRTTGLVKNEANLLDFESSTIVALPHSNGVKYPDLYSSITVDFGKEICGPVTLRSGPTSTHQTAAFAYAEGSQWVGFNSDDASSLRSSVADGHFEFQIGPNETYTVPMEKQRGGYRYLTIFTKTPEAILEIKEVSAHFTSMPHWQNLRAYPSYFFCNDELLNRLWYAAAYTNQLSTLAKNQSRRCELESGWLNNAICCTSGDTVITDAPRRDRIVWAGDFAIVIWSQFATIGDSISMRNALDTLFDVQSEKGQFPWAGPPICHDSVSDLAKSKEWPYMSDSYHLWTILVAKHFYHLTGDLDWLKTKWERIVLGMQLAVSRFRSDEGLYYCIGDLDWGRSSVKGLNLSCNILFHETLLKMAPIAKLFGSPTLATQWLEIASTLKPNLERFWGPLSGPIHRQCKRNQSVSSRRKFLCMLVRHCRSRTCPDYHHEFEEEVGSIRSHQSRVFWPSITFHLRFRTASTGPCQQNERCIIYDPQNMGLDDQQSGKHWKYHAQSLGRRWSNYLSVLQRQAELYLPLPPIFNWSCSCYGF